MSDADSSDAGRGWTMLAGLGLVVVAGLVGWTLFAGSSTDGQKTSGGGFFVGYEFDAGLEATDHEATDHEATDHEATDHEKAGRRVRAPQDSRSPSDPPQISGTIIRQKLPDAGDAGDSVDARRQDVFEWNDPANQKMLGRPSWMAKPSDEEAEAVEAALEEASRRQQKQRYPIALQERRLGVELAKDIVKDCFERLLERVPQASGRVSVAFDLVADGRRARFLNVEIPANLHLKEPGFEACITRDLSAASFRSTEQGTMHVEYPFLFGDSDQR